MNTYSVSQFAKRIGVTVHTLQRWDREGRFKALRTPTNRRLYTDDHLARVMQVPQANRARKTVVYMRVSSQGQKPDLANQRKVLEAFCVARGIAVDAWIEEIGGGLNLKRPKFLTLIDGIISGEIAAVIVAHKDRLARLGVELVQHLCHMLRLAIVHCFSARLYALRNYRKTLKKALSDAARPQNPAQSDA